MPIDLTRLGEEKLPSEEVPVPEWAELIGTGTLTVGCLSAEERGAFSHGTPDDDALASKTMTPRFVAYCLRETDGRRMYDEPELAAEHLKTKNGAVVVRLYEAARRVNGMGPKAVDTAEKN